MIKINTKPLSVNKCWMGRRFKTKDYKDFEKTMFSLLPARIEIPEGKLEMHVIFGFGSKASDVDNPIKPLQDILQKKYLFNDKKIYRLLLEKVDVEKGSEFISFELRKYQ